MSEYTVRTRLVAVLKELGTSAWRRAIEMEPEYINMGPLFDDYGFGPFATLMVVAGLNDYQLKGKAEKSYWPKLKEHLIGKPSPSSPDALIDRLVAFYEHERLSKAKLNRLDKFLHSQLAQYMFRADAREISRCFLEIWNKLAKVMGQQKNSKTIVFAMKCLGLSLILAGENGFDFGPIPIPVDSRVKSLNQRIGLTFSNEDEIRRFWSEVLYDLRNHDQDLTMIHLDSLLWQIAPLDEKDLIIYLEKGLNVPKLVAHRLAEFTSQAFRR